MNVISSANKFFRKISDYALSMDTSPMDYITDEFALNASEMSVLRERIKRLEFKLTLLADNSCYMESN